MNPIHNPFAPGAGTQPPELAGRAAIIETARVTLARIKLGRAVRSQMLLGLRGVGKTVLLNKIAELAEEQAIETIVLEAPEERRLADMLVPPLRKILLRLSRLERAKEVAQRGLGVLRAFAAAFKVKAGDVEFTVKPESGSADSGDLESDLPELMLAVGLAARAANTAVALLIDEVQYLSEADLSALIVAVHRTTQKSLPFVLFGAGLPQLASLAGEAKSYAERLFDYPHVGPLADADAREAITEPVDRENAAIDEEAVGAIIEKTRGYPYFLQEWGHHTWIVAPASPITVGDVARATGEALKALDRGFFRVRFDQLTPREKEYMRAMAELGAGPHRSGEIAEEFGIDVTTAGSLRNGLIRKGMLYSPQHGDTAFTVPLFDEFMCRTMPEWKPTAGDANPLGVRNSPNKSQRRRKPKR